MPAPSRTISRTRLKGNEVGIEFLLFRGVVSIACANLCFVFQAAHFEFDRTKLSIASFVGWIITETVKRADVCRHACERSTRIGERRGFETSPTRRAREVVHLASRQIVERAADRHSLKGTHLAEAVEILCLCLREKELSIALYLSLRKRELPVVLAVLHQTIFDEVFRVHLDEITRNAGARQLHFRGGEIGVTRRINAVRQSDNSTTATHIVLSRLAEDAVHNSLEPVVVWRALARAEIFDRHSQCFTIVCQWRQHFHSRDRRRHSSRLIERDHADAISRPQRFNETVCGCTYQRHVVACRSRRIE